MAWFDRNPGGKKGQEEERPATAETQPVSTPPPPEAAPAVKVPVPAADWRALPYRPVPASRAAIGWPAHAARR